MENSKSQHYWRFIEFPDDIEYDVTVVLRISPGFRPIVGQIEAKKRPNLPQIVCIGETIELYMKF